MTALPARDLSATRDTMMAWLHARMPRAGSIDLAPLRAAEGGSSSETIFLDVDIVEGGARRREHWVLRIQAMRHQVYADPSIARQYRVMECVRRESTAPVPRLLWLEEDPSILGAPFFVMEHVAGAVPHERYHSQGTLFDASPAARTSMWLAGVQAMAAIHRIPADRAAFLNRPALGATGLDQEIAAWDAYLDWAGVPPHPVLEKARGWIAAHMPAYRPTGLAWGDARLGNMVFREQRCCAVLDWETASLGGAESDLGWWIYYDWWVTEGTGVPRLDGIGGREETIRAWEDAIGRRADAMAWHEMFATYRFAIISERAIALALAANASLPISGGDGNPAVRRLRDLLG
ncbi:aminoglycoside phosphotransferase (APT) family kinase protein [Sphingomonas zeicaulis]